MYLLGGVKSANSSDSNKVSSIRDPVLTHDSASLAAQVGCCGDKLLVVLVVAGVIGTMMMELQKKKGETGRSLTACHRLTFFCHFSLVALQHKKCSYQFTSNRPLRVRRSLVNLLPLMFRTHLHSSASIASSPKKHRYDAFLLVNSTEQFLYY